VNLAVRHSQLVARRQGGHTLLEVAIAGALISIVLVPALALIRDGLGTSRQLQTREIVTSFCTDKLEEYLARASVEWTNGTSTGDFTADGHSEIRFSVTCSDDAGDGGITDQLMAVTATVWDDTDGDDALDADELTVVLAGKIAMMPSYQPE